MFIVSAFSLVIFVVVCLIFDSMWFYIWFWFVISNVTLQAVSRPGPATQRGLPGMYLILFILPKNQSISFLLFYFCCLCWWKLHLELAGRLTNLLRDLVKLTMQEPLGMNYNNKHYLNCHHWHQHRQECHHEHDHGPHPPLSDQVRDWSVARERACHEERAAGTSSLVWHRLHIKNYIKNL